MNDNQPQPIAVYYDRTLGHQVRRYAPWVTGLPAEETILDREDDDATEQP